jgi:hypothetical protein
MQVEIRLPTGILTGELSMLRFLIFVALLVFSLPVLAEVSAPNSIVFVVCRVDDLTGQPGRHDPSMAAKNWRDLELHVNDNQEYECKRQLVTNIEDKSQFQEGATGDMIPLAPNFGSPVTCALIGIPMAVGWDQQNPGWSVVAIGCPTPIYPDVDVDGMPDAGSRPIGWKLPGCPSYLPGTNNRMRCVFDESAV